MVHFWTLGQNLTQLWKVKYRISGKSAIFQIYKSISQKLFTISKRIFHQRILRIIISRMTHCLGILIEKFWCMASRGREQRHSQGKSQRSDMVMFWSKSCIMSPFQSMATSNVSENAISVKNRSQAVRLMTSKLRDLIWPGLFLPKISYAKFQREVSNGTSVVILDRL